MLHSAANIVEKQLTSLTSRGKVRYTISQRKNRLNYWMNEDCYWYEAALESEELKGAYEALPSHVMLIFLCRQGSQRSSRRICGLEKDPQAPVMSAEYDTVQRNLKFVCTRSFSSDLIRRVDYLSSRVLILHLTFPQFRC